MLKTTTTTTTALTHLVAADGMYDPARWNALDYEGKIGRLAGLSDLEVRAQASVIAAASHRPVAEILAAWEGLQLLTPERAAAAMRARAKA